MSAQKTAEQEQQRATECVAEGCIWHRHASGLSADLTRFGRALDRLWEYAEHQAHCGLNPGPVCTCGLDALRAEFPPYVEGPDQ